MKRILITLLIGLFALTAFGQNHGHGSDVNQRYFDAKIREFVYRLNLTDQQRDAFIPIYKRYSDEMRASVGKLSRPDERPATSEDAAALTKARIERQQIAQNIRIKYVDEFAAVLAPDQMSRLYEVESQIQRKLMSRKNGGRPGPGHRQGPRNR